MMGASGADLVVAAIGVSAVIAAGYSINRAYKSLRAWIVRMGDAAKQAFSDAVDASTTGHIVKHHLGQNGTTTPMHVRVSSIERAQTDHNEAATKIGAEVRQLDESSTVRHEENTAKFDVIAERLTAVEQGQKTAANVAEDTESRRQGDTP